MFAMTEYFGEFALARYVKYFQRYDTTPTQLQHNTPVRWSPITIDRQINVFFYDIGYMFEQFHTPADPQCH